MRARRWYQDPYQIIIRMLPAQASVHVCCLLWSARQLDIKMLQNSFRFVLCLSLCSLTGFGYVSTYAINVQSDVDVSNQVINNIQHVSGLPAYLTDLPVLHCTRLWECPVSNALHFLTGRFRLLIVLIVLLLLLNEQVTLLLLLNDIICIATFVLINQIFNSNKFYDWVLNV